MEVYQVISHGPEAAALFAKRCGFTDLESFQKAVNLHDGFVQNPHIWWEVDSEDMKKVGEPDAYDDVYMCVLTHGRPMLFMFSAFTANKKWYIARGI